MSIQRSHKIRLTPNNAQRTFFQKSCGASRFVWNWALAEWRSQYEEGGKPSGLELKRYFNSFKYTAFPWISEISKWGPERVFSNLDKAFKRFFQGKAKYPKFKHRGQHESFYISGSAIRFDGKYVILPKIGRIRMTERLRFQGKVSSVTISLRAGHWFAGIQVEIPDDAVGTTAAHENQVAASVGIDFGIEKFAVLSTGEVYENPRIFEKFYKRLRKASRSLTRKKKGSRNREKAKLKLQRIHYRIFCYRNDFLHKFTHHVTSEFAEVWCEALNIKGMVRNGKLARYISDLGWGEALRQLEYKAQRFGKRDRWYPSSQLCCACGNRQKMPLNIRTFHCEECGNKKDRDHNAAINIQLGTACPEDTPADTEALVLNFGSVRNLVVETGTNQEVL